MKILVVGATGQVGRSMRQVLSAKPLGVVLYTERKAENARGILACDLADGTSIRRVIQEVRPDVVINCAAYTAVDKAESDQEMARSINGNAPGILAEETAKTGGLLVHYSTDYVFDGQGTTPWSETSKTNPLNVYGATKCMGEELIRAANDHHLILRTQWVYAPDGQNFPRTILRLARERSTLNIVNDQFGAPTSGEVIAETTRDLIEKSLSSKSMFGTYHLACRGETTWHGFATAIVDSARQLGAELKVSDILPVPTTAFPTPAPRPSNSRLNLEKIESVLGRPMTDWRTEWRRHSSSFA